MTIIGSWTGVTPTTLGTPFGTEPPTALKTWLSTRLNGARGNYDAAGSRVLSSLNIYNISVSSSASPWKGDGTETTIRRNIASYYHHFKSSGKIFVINTHNTSDLTIEQIGWLVDELYKCGGKFVSFDTAVNEIRADHSTSDNITYTKTYADVSDFHLQPTSPARRAGINVGLTTDFAGMPVKNPPSMGAYEFFSNPGDFLPGRKWSW